MKGMTREFSMWKQDEALSQTGPRTWAIWGREDEQSPPGSTDEFTSGNTVERLTTLPLPGDPHNPLTVLAEASSGDPDGDAPQTAGRPAGTKGYYAPMEMKPVEDAPHIMSIISVQE